MGVLVEFRVRLRVCRYRHRPLCWDSELCWDSDFLWKLSKWARASKRKPLRI